MPLQYAGLTIPPAKAVNAAAAGSTARQLPAAADRACVPLVYGEDRLGGLVLNVLPTTAGGTTVLVQLLWCHACDSIADLRWNDQALPAGVGVTHYTGSQSTPDAAVVSAFAAQGITYTETLAGFATSVVTFPATLFDGSLAFSARIRGRRVYDRRLDSTAGGSGSHRLNDPATWTWSATPSLCLADFVSNTVYGAGEPVDWSTVPAAADHNDANIGSPAEPRRRLGVSFVEPASVEDIAEALRAYAGCWIFPGASGVRLLADQDVADSATYSHASGQIASIEPLALRDLGNSPTAVEVLYTDTTRVPYRQGSAIAQLAGAGTTLPWRLSQVSLPGIQRYSQAYREAVERLNKLTLQDISTTIEVFDDGIRHDVGDIISITHPIGLTARRMRITDVLMTGLGRWRLPVVEHDPAVYSSAVATLSLPGETARVIGAETAVSWDALTGRPADSAILNSFQVIGQNLLAESDQTAAVRFVVGYNPNSAVLEGGAVRYTSSVPGWDTNNYVLSGGRLRNVFARQVGRHTGTGDTVADSLGNTVALDFVFDGPVPVIPGQRLFGSVYVTAHRCKCLVYLMLSDAAGNNIAFPVGSESVAPAALANVLGNYERVSVAATVPANVAFARLVLRKFNTFVGQADSYVFWAAPQLEVAAAQATGPSPYMPGPASGVAQLGYAGDLDATRGAPTGTLVGATLAQTVEANAANALSNAAAAQSAANTANAAIADSAADNKLSPVEKQRDVIIYTSLLNDQAGLNAEADRYGITTEKAALATALTALASNVGPLLASLTTTSDITGSAYRTYFADALAAKQALLNRVAEEAGKRAVWASVTGTGRPQDNATVGAPTGTLVGSTLAQTVEANAANALSNAAAAQSAANTANAAIADSAADNKLSPVEKQRDVIIYNSLLNDQAGLNAEADRYGITTEKAALATALTALFTNVSGLLSNLTTTSDITGSSYRGYFADALNAKQVLLNRIAEEAGKRAQWAGVSGTGRPSDNATRDITFVNHGGTVTVEGNALTKASTGNAESTWDSGVASRESYAGGAFVSFSPAQTGKFFMMGLNTASDTSDAGYLTLDYAIYIEGTTVFAFESGAGYGPLDTYAAGDTFAVVYDGYRVRYLKNGAPMAREVKVNITAPLFMDSSFYHRGARAERIVFGPMSAMRGFEWGQMSDLVIDRNSAIRSGKTSPTDSTLGYWIGWDAGVPRAIFGAGPGNRIVIDNTAGVTQEIPQAQLQTTGVVQNIGLLAGQVTSGGATATATIRLYTDGTCDGGANWYAPTTTSVGAGYYARFRRLSGNTPTGSALDTWLQLNSNRAITLSATAEIKNASGVIDISTSASGTPIVGQIPWELHAESYSGVIP